MDYKVLFYFFTLCLLIVVIGCYAYTLLDYNTYKEEYIDYNVYSTGPTGPVGPAGKDGVSGQNTNTGPQGPTGLSATSGILIKTYTVQPGSANEDGKLFYWNTADGGYVRIFAAKLPDELNDIVPINLVFNNYDINYYYLTANDGLTVQFQSLQIPSTKSYTNSAWQIGDNGINYAGFDYFIVNMYPSNGC